MNLNKLSVKLELVDYDFDRLVGIACSLLQGKLFTFNAFPLFCFWNERLRIGICSMPFYVKRYGETGTKFFHSCRRSRGKEGELAWIFTQSMPRSILSRVWSRGDLNLWPFPPSAWSRGRDPFLKEFHVGWGERGWNVASRHVPVTRCWEFKHEHFWSIRTHNENSKSIFFQFLNLKLFFKLNF